jgi:hypothetical protein
MATKKTIIAAAVTAAIALSLALAPTADAKVRRQFSTDKSFGVGLMVGAPSGLTAKYYLDTPLALAFGLGSSHYGHHDGRNDRYHNDGIHFHTDVLWHPVVLMSDGAIQLPLHIGIGGQIRNHGNADNNTDHSHLGARVPFGISVDFQRVPLDIFFELAFALEFVDSSHSYITGSLGARYYF